MAGQLNRYLEIAEVFARHGLAATAIQAGLGRWLPGDADELDADGDDDLRPELLVSAFEELGTTFVKLGQMISTRPDVFPESYCDAFSKLTDSNRPITFEDAAAVVEEDLGAPVDELYPWFDREPLASASIGQVHRARLHDGRDVVVKVRKPGVVETVHDDLEILRNLATRLSRNSQTLEDMDVVGLVEEFDRSLRAELDYLTEAQACKEIGENFSDDDRIRIPWIEWDLTTSRVLTMEEVTGTRIDNLDALDRAGIDRPDLAYRVAAMFIRMVFEDGLFHADPHAGNLLVEKDGTVDLIDFGSVGWISPTMRRQFARIIVAFAGQDTDGLVKALTEIAPPRGNLDRRRLRADVGRVTERFEGRPLSSVRMEVVVNQVFDIVRRHRLSLPPEIVQLFRMLIIAEGLARKVDPEFDLSTILTGYAGRIIEERLSPKRIAEQLRETTTAAANFGADLPDYMRKAIDLLESGGVDVNVQVAELEPLITRMERTSDRMVVALVVAAMITGGTNILAAYKDRLGKFAGPLVAAGGAALTGASAYLAWTGRPRHGRFLR